MTAHIGKGRGGWLEEDVKGGRGGRVGGGLRGGGYDVYLSRRACTNKMSDQIAKTLCPSSKSLIRPPEPPIGKK